MMFPCHTCILLSGKCDILIHKSLIFIRLLCFSILYLICTLSQKTFKSLEIQAVLTVNWQDINMNYLLRFRLPNPSFPRLLAINTFAIGHCNLGDSPQGVKSRAVDTRRIGTKCKTNKKQCSLVAWFSAQYTVHTPIIEL